MKWDSLIRLNEIHLLYFLKKKINQWDETKIINGSKENSSIGWKVIRQLDEKEIYQFDEYWV